MGNIDKALMITLRAEVTAALASIAEKHGVTLSLGNGSFDSMTGKFPLNVTATADGKAINTDAANFLKYVGEHPFKATDLGRVFKSNGEDFEITGFKPRSSKKALIAKRLSNGQLYVFNEYDVKVKLDNIDRLTETK